MWFDIEGVPVLPLSEAPRHQAERIVPVSELAKMEDTFDCPYLSGTKDEPLEDMCEECGPLDSFPTTYLQVKQGVTVQVSGGGFKNQVIAGSKPVDWLYKI